MDALSEFLSSEREIHKPCGLGMMGVPGAPGPVTGPCIEKEIKECLLQNLNQNKTLQEGGIV